MSTPIGLALGRCFGDPLRPIPVVWLGSYAYQPRMDPGSASGGTPSERSR